MSSDPLPLPEIWSDLPEGEVESVRTSFAANGRGSLVLIDYASGYAQQPDAKDFARMPGRSADTVAREHLPSLLPSLAPAALLKGLADLASIVSEAEALLRVQATLNSDVHFAVEHIHDVAMALRMRDVEQALCDTLDASVREVGDALVRHEAAGAGATSAAAMLRDVMRRIEDLTIVASGMSAVGAKLQADEAHAADSVDTSSARDERERPLLNIASARNDAAAVETLVAGTVVTDAGATAVVQTDIVDAGGTDASVPDIAATEAAGDAVVAYRSVPQGEAIAAGEDEATALTVASSRQPANDPLAVLHGLSEEELIALFS
jgi:uncharacterized protein YoxC